MVSDFWNESIYLRECEYAWYAIWVRHVWTQAMPIARVPLLTLIWSRNCPKVVELSLFNQKFDADIMSKKACSKNE